MVQPSALRARVTLAIEQHERLLLTWDAPLSFSTDDFYSRPIDKAARRWCKSMEARRIEDRSIGVGAFANLSHWAVTCHSVGFPFGSPPRGLRLLPHDAGNRLEPGAYIAEVHPAVALGCWWIDRGIDEMMPRYKGSIRVARKRVALSRIVDRLGFPEEAGRNDDVLDAYVAWLLGREFLAGNARLVGSIEHGGYILPCGKSADTIHQNTR